MFYFKGTRKPDFKNISRNIYDDYWKERGFTLRGKLMERELIFFNWIKPKSKVLSIGCGNSRLLYDLKNQKQCNVLGIDIANSVVDGLNSNHIKAILADVSSESFDLGSFVNEKFDYIIMSELLEHLVMPEQLVEKTKNWTTYTVISVPNSAFYRYRLGLMFGGRFFTQWAKHPSEHLRYWSHKDFIDWLDAKGLFIEDCISSNGPKVLRDIWPNMFGHQICYLCEEKK